MNTDNILDAILAIALGMALGVVTCFFVLLGIIIPPVGISMVAGGVLGYVVYAKPEWVNKFWKQKEYRE